jgi:hypothetical protein
MVMPQPASDAILREARTNLETIRNQLGAAGTTDGAARVAINKAIRELELALSVR